MAPVRWHAKLLCHCDGKASEAGPESGELVYKQDQLRIHLLSDEIQTKGSLRDLDNVLPETVALIREHEAWQIQKVDANLRIRRRVCQQSRVG